MLENGIIIVDENKNRKQIYVYIIMSRNRNEKIVNKFYYIESTAITSSPAFKSLTTASMAAKPVAKA